MRLIFVHGWSVTSTKTYGGLPEALVGAFSEQGLDLDIQHLYLGRYISFHDEVTLDDIACALDAALRDLPDNQADIQPFSCITHSTGGPVVRHWVDRFYGAERLADLPLRHLVMLAPANHGSALAALGKSRVGRLKAWFQGIEPGQRVLDWLCLGSDGQWLLNRNGLEYDYAGNGFFPFVLTGQGIDEKLYDFLNSYLVEQGSDGVVRVAGANMNYRRFSLVQSDSETLAEKPGCYVLSPDGPVEIPEAVPLGVYKSYSHTGKRLGIMQSIRSANVEAPVVSDILQCLKVETASEYSARTAALEELTRQEQLGGSVYCMLVFNIKDDQGHQLHQGDYDLILLAGKEYAPDVLPGGFFKDRQINTKSGRLVYYLDAEKMKEVKDGLFGFRVIARPVSGFCYYQEAEYRSGGIDVESVLVPNQTVYIDITLHRFIDENVFRFDPADAARRNFKRIKPSGNSVHNA